MFYLIFASVSANLCEPRFSQIVNNELKPRIHSYLSQGEGLDYMEPISTCQKQENSTYALFTWGKDQMNLVGFGFCIPGQCQETLESYLTTNAQEDISKIYSKQNDLIFINLQAKASFSPAALFFSSMFGLLILLTLLGTCVTKSDFLLNFDFFKNLGSMFHLEPDAEGFEYLDGFRALCSICIMFLHDYIFSMGVVLKNRKEYSDNINSLFTTWVRSFNFGVDIFFYIAGFLMSILTLREIQRKGKNFSILKCILRRLTRYLPVYLFIIGVDRCFVKAVPANSRSILSFVFLQNLQGGWWKNLLFVHNILTEGKTPYLAWTWSVAADFQFYIVSVFLVFCYSRSKSLAYLISFVLCTLSSVANFYIAYEYDLKPTNLSQMEMRQYGLNYSAPIPRCSPFFIGVVFGLVYSSRKKDLKVSVAYEQKNTFGDSFERFCLNVFKNNGFRKSLYFVGAVFMTFSHAIPAISEVYGAEVFSKEMRSVYYCFYKVVFALGFSFFAFAMSLGHLQHLKNALSGYFFRFMGKVSYTFFLIHPFVFAVLNLRGDEPYECTKVSWFFNSLILYVLSMVVTMIIFALVESPLQKVIKTYISR